MKAYLIVDKKEYAENVDKIKEGATDQALKKEVSILLKRDLTDEESLLQFAATQENEEREDLLDLDLKKNFFYVINPQGKIIDCA